METRIVGLPQGRILELRRRLNCSHVKSGAEDCCYFSIMTICRTVRKTPAGWVRMDIKCAKMGEDATKFPPPCTPVISTQCFSMRGRMADYSCLANSTEVEYVLCCCWCTSQHQLSHLILCFHTRSITT